MTGSTLSIPELFHHAGLPEGHTRSTASVQDVQGFDGDVTEIPDRCKDSEFEPGAVHSILQVPGDDGVLTLTEKNPNLMFLINFLES